MCGFVGVLRPRSAGPVRADALHRLLPSLHHRGPDQQGVFVRAGFGLAAARLRIRGGAEGDQPLVSPDGLRALAFNGELLFGPGASPGICDTPHFLTLLEEEGIPPGPGGRGTGVLGRCLGQTLRRNMGALALYDALGGCVELWRDPLGIKPLYTAEGVDGSLWFASELTPLLRALPERRKASVQGLADLLAWQRPRRQLPFEGIQTLAPGHGIRWGLDAHGYRGGERSSLRALGAVARPPAGRDVVGRVRAAWRGAASAAAATTGPVSLFLSGGLDSSAVAAFADREDLLCLTGRFEPRGGAFDESIHAQALADFLHLRHEFVDLRDADLIEDLPRVIRALEMPLAGPGSLALWRLARRARRHGPVVLTGTGGDELFCGYTRAALILGRAGPWTRGYEPLRARIEAAGQALGGRLRAAFDRSRDLEPLLARDFLRSLPAPAEPRLRAGEPACRSLQREECSGTLSSLLHVEDRVLMAHGLEGRPVACLGDLEAVARALPGEWLIGPHGEGKRALRAALKGHIPESVRLDPHKRGFPTPFARAARGVGRSFVQDLLADRRFAERGWWEVAACKALLEEERPGYDRALFALLSWEIWARLFLDGDAFRGDRGAFEGCWTAGEGRKTP